MRIAIGAVAVVLVLALLVVLIGWLLPVRHRAMREATFRTTPDRLFALITTPADFPKWRTGIQRVDVLPAVDGHAQYREVSSGGSILYAVVRSVPDRELVTEIADRTLPFGGRWTYELIPVSADSTTLRITEDGAVYNPVFRFISRFVIGHTATISRYLNDVERRIRSALVPPGAPRDLPVSLVPPTCDGVDLAT